MQGVHAIRPLKKSCKERQKIADGLLTIRIDRLQIAVNRKECTLTKNKTKVQKWRHAVKFFVTGGFGYGASDLSVHICISFFNTQPRNGHLDEANLSNHGVRDPPFADVVCVVNPDMVELNGFICD